MPAVRKLHLNITITGRVQGVGFRFAAKSMAKSLGIKGFVENLYNGQVYVEAEGSEVQLKHFLNWCHQGPSFANVEEVYSDEAELKGFRYFDIKH